jgi:hypothetical protein
MSIKTAALSLCAAVVLAAPLAARAAPPPDLAGRWVFSAARSRNVGMMADVAVTTTVVQSRARIVVDDTSVFQGRSYVEHTVYDLGGGASQNTSPMTGASTGRSHWEAGALVTDWERPGAVAGVVNHRIETRRLAPDGRSMVVESRTADKEPMVMVFERP